MLRKLALAVAVALLCLAGTAQAFVEFDLQVEPAGEMSLASEGKVSFTGGGITVRCNMTFATELLSGPITARAGQQIGEGVAEGSAFANCEGGQIRTALNAPWAMRITIVLGTMPNAATGLEITMPFQLEFSVFGGFVNCLYGGNALLLWRWSGTNPYTGGRWQFLSAAIPRVSGALCPTSMTIAGTLNMSPGQSLSLT